MARITYVDTRNSEEINSKDCAVVPEMRCKICEYFFDLEDDTVGYKGYNCVCKTCMKNMADVFELSESDLEDIITNAGRHLAEGIEQ